MRLRPSRVLVALLLASFALNLYGNDWGLPNFIRVDERPWGFHKSFLWEYATGVLATEQTPARLPGVIARPQREQQYQQNPDKVPAQYRYMVGFDAYSTALRRLAEVGD